MQVNVTQQNKQSFSALYMDTAQIAKVFGEEVAKSVEFARPKLEDLACDVDIFVIEKPNENDFNESKIEFHIKDITERKSKLVKNKIKRKVLNYLEERQISKKNFARAIIYPFSDLNISQKIIEEVIDKKRIHQSFWS